MNHVPPEALELPVEGPGLSRRPFRAVLGEQRTLLVFLRHFG